MACEVCEECVVGRCPSRPSLLPWPKLRTTLRHLRTSHQNGFNEDTRHHSLNLSDNAFMRTDPDLGFVVGKTLSPVAASAELVEGGMAVIVSGTVLGGLGSSILMVFGGGTACCSVRGFGTSTVLSGPSGIFGVSIGSPFSVGDPCRVDERASDADSIFFRPGLP
jgi:hypothetical protein